jgi:DNA-directed RNA polymerase subunit D
MEVRVVDKTDVTARLIIEDVEVPFMNALRRIMLVEVPSMVIDEVVVLENSSILHDEIMAHRLGLVPLKTDLDSYNLPEECPCKSEFGCNLCRVTLTLDVEATDSVRTVYSSDLVPNNPDIAPVSKKIPLVKLAPTQRIRLEAYARLGKGKEHAKWQPVSGCAYKYFPEVRINQKTCDACGKCVEMCPKRVLTNVGKKVEIRNVTACTLCQDCVDACPKGPTAIEASWDKNAFIFDIESSGGLPVERILFEAVKILDRKAENFLNLLTEKKR